MFFEQATETIESLSELILRVERDPADTEALRTIRRAVHTLKGDSAATGFRELSEIAHELEDALQPEVTATAAPSELVDLVLSAADVFEAMLAAYRGTLKPPSTVNPFCASRPPRL